MLFNIIEILSKGCYNMELKVVIVKNGDIFGGHLYLFLGLGGLGRGLG
jgi:hypothetical protein